MLEVDANWGPLAALAGEWKGREGEDTAPSPKRGTEVNHFREELKLVPMNPVKNHEQTLYALRYSTVAWEGEQTTPFHEEVGYWLWDAERRLLMREFMVPRGVVVLAGGTVPEGASEFELSAQAGDEVFGICSNPFLQEEFKTIRYDLKLTLHDDGSFSYFETTHLKIKGQDEVFKHTDRNHLIKV